MKTDSKVCPAELAGGLDNSIRKLLHNPEKILKQYIKKGMTILDVGCGPGHFSIPIAKMLNGSGKVIAADLQEAMLDKLLTKIKGTGLEQRIELHKCGSDSIGVNEKADFILAFYMIHEVPDRSKLLQELKSVLKPDGKFLIVEPKIHVSKKEFTAMLDELISMHFEIIEKPKVFFSRAVVIQNK